MSRDGSGVYHVPAGTYGIPNTTIASTPYNANVDDVAQDLNTPRPIVAGGTGATNGPAALANLGGLPATGGTMTGDLTINKATPQIKLQKTAAGQVAAITGFTGVNPRWEMDLGDGTAESGGNAGSNFVIRRFDDATNFLDAPLTITRSTGLAAFAQAVTVAGTLTVNGNETLGGSATPALSFIPTSGATKTGQIFQQGDSLVLAAASVGSRFSINLNTGVVTVPATTASTSPATGALTVAGGLGVAAAANIGTTLKVGSTAFGATSVAVNIAWDGAAAYGIGMRPNTDGGAALWLFNAAGTQIGSITQTASNVAYNTTSDERLKEDMQPFDAGPIIDQTKVYDFAWRASGERAHGVIAQEAIQVFPEAVTHVEHADVWAVDYSKYVPLLLQEIKDLRARVAALEAR